MARTRFARMLSERRKQLRLSIPQAAKVLRMRESVLEAFEEGDFAHLPALGYAQGMISSYARYLGLDSRQVAELYEREHAEYVSGVTGREPSALARLEDEPFIDGPASAASDSRSNFPAASARASATHVSLPSAASSSAWRPSSAYGAPTGAASSRGPYGSSRALPASSQPGEGAGYERGERRYTTRVPSSGDDRARRQQDARARRSRGADGYGRPRSEERSGATSRYAGASDRGESRQGPRPATRGGASRGSRGYVAGHSDEITTRRVGSGQYRDDMRFDGAARPYRPSSTRAGREASRGMVAPERPNVRRRQPPPQSRDPRSRLGRQAPRGGLVSTLLADQRRVALVIGLLLAVALVLILAFSIRSCAAGGSSGKQVSVVTVTTTDAASTAASTSSAAEQQALSEAAAKRAASDAAAQSQETKVTVSVADGSTTWVDIQSDGTQEVAETVTGAWSREYTVTKSLTIQVGDASAVTVEKNGERVQLTKTSGTLAGATITGTDPSASATASATSSSTASTTADSGSSSKN